MCYDGMSSQGELMKPRNFWSLLFLVVAGVSLSLSALIEASHNQMLWAVGLPCALLVVFEQVIIDDYAFIVSH